MFAGLVTLFRGDNLKTTVVTVVACVVGLLLLGSVAYAGYSWHARGEEDRLKAVQDAMRKVFDAEKADLIKVYRRADEIDKSLTDFKKSMAETAGQQVNEMKNLRKQFKEVYEAVLPPEGIKQWERSRDMYNEAARRRSPQ